MTKIFILILLILPMGIFAQAKGKSTITSVQGTASYYADNFEGQETATGEKFKNKALTGASNSFNLNSWVRVTNLRNRKSVIIRIIDRMHPRMARGGRVVDLTHKAANKINMIAEGLASVKVELVPNGTQE